MVTATASPLLTRLRKGNDYCIGIYRRWLAETDPDKALELYHTFEAGLDLLNKVAEQLHDTGWRGCIYGKANCDWAKATCMVCLKEKT